MAQTVFLHIGLPKTGTTYLQGIAWAAKKQLRRDGLLLPGSGHREHLWAALEVQQRRGLAKRHPSAPGSWRRLVEEVDAFPGRALITHEFLCGATRAQAAAAVASFGGAEVHLIITARDTLGMLTAGWQESVKNGSPLRMGAIAGRRGPGAGSEFGWRTWDLGKVLRRWTGHVPADRVHILPMPDRTVAAPDAHWRAFAEVLGLDPDRYPAPARAANPAIGYAQVELLRRVNRHLDGFDSSVDRGEWIRGYLAEHLLARQEARPITAPPRLVQRCVKKADRAIAMILEGGFDVRGDLERLRVRPPGDPAAPGAEASSPSDTDVADAAARLVADMLTDVRDLSRGQASVARSARDRGRRSPGRDN